MDKKYKKILFDQIVADTPFQRHLGHGLIGYGHFNGGSCFSRFLKLPKLITKDEAESLLSYDIDAAEAFISRVWPRSDEFSPIRFNAFVNLLLVLGWDVFSTYEELKAAAVARNWETVCHYLDARIIYHSCFIDRMKRIRQQLLTGRGEL